MTSLLERLLRLFPKSVPLEVLFTEVLARLLGRNPQLCLAWLEGAGLPSTGSLREGPQGARVLSFLPRTQKSA